MQNPQNSLGESSLGLSEAIGFAKYSFSLCLNNWRVFLLLCAASAVCLVLLNLLIDALFSLLCGPSCLPWMDKDFVLNETSDMQDLLESFSANRKSIFLFFVAQLSSGFLLATYFSVAWCQFLWKKMSGLPLSFSLRWTKRHTRIFRAYLELFFFIILFLVCLIFLLLLTLQAFDILGLLGFLLLIGTIFCVLSFVGILLRMYLIIPILAIRGEGRFQEILTQTKKQFSFFSLLMPAFGLLVFLVMAIFALFFIPVDPAGETLWLVNVLTLQFMSSLVEIFFLTLFILLARHFFPQYFTTQQPT